MISQIIPKLPFIDKEKTLQYYQNLGFEFPADYGQYLIAVYNNSELHFFEFESLIPEKSDFMLYLKISNNIDKFYQQIQDKGIAIHPNGSLETKPWGMREFSLIDPNGTLLTFGEKMN
ncbi:bleomycin resistance protein [Epilithonimonas zeae]|uniref:bleomycin resistance protein n=1 Tax=Epilithonimonas zeae TaxID=1416779 RepID=UPI00200F77CF|nr:VOC family protein [Epilithonimonas zeae]UQB69433.1 VOC family protein [Epilithonimonas zeae]